MSDYRQEETDLDGGKKDAEEGRGGSEEVKLIDLPDLVSFGDVNESREGGEDDGSENRSGSVV